MTVATVNPRTIDEAVEEHLRDNFADTEVEALAESYAQYGFARISQLVPAEVFQAVKDEVYRLLEAHARRIDIDIPETGNTRRAMSTVGQAGIAADATLIPAIYSSTAIKSFLSRIAGEQVVDCPWDQEKYVIIRQERMGDTHGWHWGDFPFTVIWLFEVPSPEVGGSLQTVAHTSWDKQNPRLEEWLASAEPQTWHFSSGDIYFLRSDTTLHRTTPLSQDTTRVILNTCWGSVADLGREQSHETMFAMFGDGAESSGQ
jgi:hypothetical protein